MNCPHCGGGSPTRVEVRGWVVSDETFHIGWRDADANDDERWLERHLHAECLHFDPLCMLCLPEPKVVPRHYTFVDMKICRPCVQKLREWIGPREVS